MPEAKNTRKYLSTAHRHDSLTPKRRSWNMSRIKSSNTKPEIAVRRALHALGFRFRLHVKNLPGKPDIVLSKFKTIVFVHGCFWHRHQGCKFAYTPKSRPEFWLKKFELNVARDKRNVAKLKALGWNIYIFWQCEIASESKFNEKLRKIEKELKLEFMN